MSFAVSYFLAVLSWNLNVTYKNYIFDPSQADASPILGSKGVCFNMWSLNVYIYWLGMCLYFKAIETQNAQKTSSK